MYNNQKSATEACTATSAVKNNSFSLQMSEVIELLLLIGAGISFHATGTETPEDLWPNEAHDRRFPRRP